MFGWKRKKRKNKGSAATDVVDGIADGCVPDGCGCDLVIALVIIAGAPLLLLW